MSAQVFRAGSSRPHWRRSPPRAQPHAHGVRGQDQLLRHKNTESADDFSALGLGLLQFLDAQAVDLGEHKVQVFHALEAAFLAQVDIPVKFPQDLEQPLVGGKSRFNFSHMSS